MKQNFALIGTMIALAVGCGGPAHVYDSVVTGTVTIDGELAKSGTLAFHPVKEGMPATGRIHEDGSYSLRTGQGDLSKVDGGTVMSGEYLVTANITALPVASTDAMAGGPPIPGPSLISARYAEKSTTDLRFTVKPGEQVIVLNLDRAEPQPTADEEEAATAESAAGETVEDRTSMPESDDSAAAATTDNSENSPR